ncbi:MAG: protein-L-isoaspartate O-methyltransferase [Candidatus Wildermuthbacteria bacterium GWA2_46_15]|uniref:Protein-L-isoaspartate O-methyltransferase n=1 Tax=Candidatus Wildermuthbacteria bacterium GWA2_46_15 TaxID=1802443 RepID=A0A1G2QPL5_9BACT|nr:MAG: protein-L-isoaspartate O-methyltransferase [Candidatus Wildermuthbacteria bacterium GWA2_46_15]
MFILMELVDSLISRGWLKTPRIIKAFRKIKRVDFLPEDLKDLSELNEALSIGHEQTISQPLVVAFMLELLQPEPGQKMLDIGSGSGYTTAILAAIVSGSNHGKVIGIEIIPELAEFGKRNVDKYDFIRQEIAEIVCVDGNLGYPKEAPFDRILVSASLSDEIPLAWKGQLKIGGRIVTPIANSIWLFIKKDEAEFEKYEYPGFVFVPLVKS